MWEAIAPHVNGDIKERNVGEDYALETDDDWRPDSYLSSQKSSHCNDKAIPGKHKPE